MERQNVTFRSDSQECAGWFYTPDQPATATVVMAHGLAAVKEMRLDAYAERFDSAGYNVLVFDYRHFGASADAPRQLLDLAKQRKDFGTPPRRWRSAPTDRPSRPPTPSTLSSGTPTRALLHTLAGHTVTIKTLAFGSDGHTLATSAYDHSIRLWDVATGTALQRLPYPQEGAEPASEVTFSSDGKFLATTTDFYNVQLRDPHTLRTVRTISGTNHLLFRLVFSPGGETLAATDVSHNITLWNVATGAVRQTLKGSLKGDYESLVFSPDGQTLVTSGSPALFWSVGTGKVSTRLPYTGYGDVVAFSRNGILATACADGKVRFWSL